MPMMQTAFIFKRSGITSNLRAHCLRKENGVACCVKHLVANDQENRRSYVSAEVSEYLVCSLQLAQLLLILGCGTSFKSNSLYGLPSRGGEVVESGFGALGHRGCSFVKIGLQTDSPTVLNLLGVRIKSFWVLEFSLS